MAKSYRGGIPFKRKYASPRGAVSYLPDRIFLSLNDGEGCSLNEGDTVKKYGKLIDASESSPAVFAGVGGKIEALRRIANRVDITLLTDVHAEVEAPFPAPEKNITDMTGDELAKLLLERGITPVKRGKRDPRTLTVDCGGSPYNDSRLYVCRAFPQKVVLGAKIIMKLIGARTCNFAIPSSDLTAAENIYREIAENSKMFKISLTKDKLPATVPNLALSALYNVEVNAAKDIFDVGYPVVSPLTCLSCYRALVEGIPFCEGFLTVAEVGSEIDLFRVPFGSVLREIADPNENERVIRAENLFGAELLGETMNERVEAIAVMKNEPKKERVTVECIKCRRCTDTCPAGLSPIKIHSSVKNGTENNDLVLYAAGCFECRSCSYICPSEIPLAETIIKFRRNNGLISVVIDRSDPDFYDDNEEKETKNEQ